MNNRNHAVIMVILVLLLPSAMLAQWSPTGSTDPISHNGPVTVGTSTITSGLTLDVSGTSRLQGNVFLGSPTFGISTFYLWPDASGPYLRGTGPGIDIVGQGGMIHVFNGDTKVDGFSGSGAALTVRGSSAGAGNAAVNVTDLNATSLMFVRNDGHVGIGTTSPLAALSNTSTNILDSFGAGINLSAILWRASGQGYAAAVRNDDANPNFRNGLVVSTAATDASSYALSVDTGAAGQLVNRLTVRADGHVGIGTTSPLAALSNTSTNILDSFGAGSNLSAILWRASGQGYAAAVRNDDANPSFRNGLVVSTAATDASSYVLSVDTGAAGQLVNRLTVRADGNVGIGTSAPLYKLHVAGSIKADQVIGATYQDVAEWVPATAKMSPGTVVVVQRGAKNTVMPSATAYATSVAGVVSEKPGLILGESSDSKAMIATTGRVKVHVDASSGAIEAGDLLVTSGKPGMAMKSQPVDLGGVKFHRPGTLIGKALESLPNGEGDILVLLSLQ